MTTPSNTTALATAQRHRGARPMAAAFVAALMAAFGVACGGSVLPEEIIPAGANVVAFVDLTAVAADEDVATLYESMDKDPDEPATFAAFLEELDTVLGTGVDQLSQVMAFADTSSETYFGALAAGSFDRDAIFASIDEEASGGTQRSEYEGHDLLTAGEAGDGQFAVAVLDDTLVLGTLQAVEDVIDVVEGNADPLSGLLLDRLDAMDDAWLKLAADLGGEAAGALDDLGWIGMDMPFDLGSMADIDGAGLSIDKQGSDFVVEVTATYASPEAAEKAAEAIEAIATLIEAFLLDDESNPITGLLDAIEVGSTENTLSVTIAVSVEQLQVPMDDTESVEDLGFGI